MAGDGEYFSTIVELRVSMSFLGLLKNMKVAAENVSLSSTYARERIYQRTPFPHSHQLFRTAQHAGDLHAEGSSSETVALH